MTLFTVIVSYERPDLLEETVRSYRETVEVEHEIVIVDNASGEETRKLIRSLGIPALMLPENRYPGYATNRGWRLHDPRAHSILHRSDNDVRYLPGWSKELTEAFQGQRVGQVGLMTDLQEGASVPAVGGNMAILRKVYEKGVRYSDEPWDVVPWEDGTMTRSVVEAGWRWTRVSNQCLVHLGDPPDFDDPYYRQTYSIRGLDVPG
jgi:GT2 family glycosyltransferase